MPLSNSRHFFDVGANTGQTFDAFLAKDRQYDGWRVWCFEPSPRHLPELMTKAQQYGSLYDIQLCPFGLRGEAGILPLHQKSDTRGDSFEPYLGVGAEVPNLYVNYTLHVPAAKVDDFILANTNAGDKITLKLDCEGSEYGILQALACRHRALERVERIFVEWHSISPENPGKLMNHLMQAYELLGHPLEDWMF